jgi:hypothetical protein
MTGIGQERTFDLMRPIPLIALYVLVAPPLGGLLFWGVEFVPLLANAVLDGRMDDRMVAATTKMALMHAGFSYLVGLLPAICTGVGHVLLRRGSLPYGLRIIAVGLLGFCSTAALLSVGGWRLAGDLALPMLFAGTCAAVLLAWMFERAGSSPHQPTPLNV